MDATRKVNASQINLNDLLSIFAAQCKILATVWENIQETKVALMVTEDRGTKTETNTCK